MKTKTTILSNSNGVNFCQGEEVLVRHLGNRPYIGKINALNTNGIVEVKRGGMNDLEININSLEKL